MDWLEDELKQALRRKEPSPDFEAKVTAAAGRRRHVIAMPRWLAAAAAVLVITGAGAGYRYHQGQAAKEQVMLAMRLAGSKLNRIQMQMKVARP
jgi:type VI protein secretion system component VasF